EKFEYIQALLVLLDTLEAQADLAGARKKADEASKLAAELGSTQQLADVKLKLAEFDLDEGHGREAEATLPEILKIFIEEKSRDNEVEARCALALSLLLQQKAAEAKAVLDDLRNSGQWQNV